MFGCEQFVLLFHFVDFGLEMVGCCFGAVVLDPEADGDLFGLSLEVDLWSFVGLGDGLFFNYEC